MSDITVSTSTGVGALQTLLNRCQGRIAAALPKHLTPARMINLALTAFSKTPELHDCDPLSIVGCVVQASQLGLEIDGTLGHAYLVPFYNTSKKCREAQLIVGYKGYISLARRSGQVHQFGAHVVYEGDIFEAEYGTNQHITHRPTLKGRGEPIAVYSIVHPAAGPIDFEIMRWVDILEHREKHARRNKAGEMVGPWVDHLAEMARKTPIRLHAKRLPLSPEFQRAAVLDDLADRGIEQGIEEELGLTRSDATLARLPAKMASDEQRQQIQTLAEEIGKTADGLSELAEQVGCTDAAQLTHAQASEILSLLTEEAATISAG